MKALYERVLAHVPTPQLHDSYNAVLHEEFASVAQTLDDVVAAYAKLEEVRDAISKLQQSHEPSTGGRSGRLKASAEDTMGLQQLLQRQVENLAVGMEVTQPERKRKREATVPSAVSPIPSKGGDKGRCNTAAKKPKRLEVDADSHCDCLEKEMKRSVQVSKGEEEVVVKQEVAATSKGSEKSSSSESESEDEADDAEGSEAAWKALTTKAAEPITQVQVEPGSPMKQKEPGTSAVSKPLIKSATYMTTIAEAVEKLPALDRSFIIPEVLTRLKESVEEDVDGTQKSAVYIALRIVVGWLDRRKELHVQYAALYREYVAVVESYTDRLPISAEKAKLKRMTRILTVRIKHFGEQLAPGSKTTAEVIAAIEEAKEKKPFSNVAQYNNIVPFEKRIQWPLHVLVSFKKETAHGVSKNSFGKRLIKVYGKISRWFRAYPHQVLLYRMILNAIRELVNRTPKLPTKHRVINMLEDMTEAVSDPSNSTRLAKIRSCVSEILAEVKQYQTRLIEPKQANKLTLDICKLVKQRAMGWSPYLDATMCKCVKELKTVVERAKAPSKDKARGVFQVCIERLAKWKVDDPPDVV